MLLNRFFLIESASYHTAYALFYRCSEGFVNMRI